MERVIQRDMRENRSNAVDLSSGSTTPATQPVTKKARTSESPTALRSIENGHPVMQYKYMCPKTYQEKISIMIVLPSGFDGKGLDDFLPVLGEDGNCISFTMPYSEYLTDPLMLTAKCHSWMNAREYEKDKVAKLAGLIPALAEAKSHFGKDTFSSRITVQLMEKCDLIMGDVNVSTFPVSENSPLGMNCPCVMANIELGVESQKVKKSSTVSMTFWQPDKHFENSSKNLDYN